MTRVLISNTDALGDVVLREPMFRSLAKAGWSLTLIVRPHVAPLMPQLAPDANIVECDDPDDAAAFCDIIEAAGEIDVLVTPARRLTSLDEHLASTLDARHAAFAPADAILQVEPESTDLASNRALAGALLGKNVRAGDPKLEPTTDQLAAADAVLESAGFDPGSFWLAYVVSPDAKAWGIDNWATLLSSWSSKHDRRFLLIGHEKEQSLIESLTASMSEQDASVAAWYGRTNDDLGVLVGLASRAGGYVGGETGAMHVAAAVGRPVLGLFAPGASPRRAPAVDPSVAIGAERDLADVEVDHMMRAADDLEKGKLKRRARRFVAAPEENDVAELTAQIQESIELARRRATEDAARIESLEKQIAALTAERDQAVAARQSLEVENAKLQASERELRDRLEAETRRAAALDERLDAIVGREEEISTGLEALRSSITTPDTGDELKAARERLAAIQGEFEDAMARLDKSQADQKTLSALSRQQAKELIVVRRRIDELLASRWRKLGQKIGVAMVLPWEHDKG